MSLPEMIETPVPVHKPARAKPAPAHSPPPALKLYEATAALVILDDLIEEHAEAIAAAGGDLEAVPEIAELLAFAEGAFDVKVEQVALKVREYLAAAAGVDLEAKRLAARAKSIENRANGLKAYLKRNLDARGIEKVKGDLVNVRVQKNSAPSVSCASELVLEELYLSGSPFVTRKEVFALDSKAVVEAWKIEAPLPDGVLVATGSHLRID